MNDTANATARKPLPLGAREAQPSNRVFVNIRIGQIAQTSKDQLPGFEPAQTKNKDGTVNNFFAKVYGDITGYVKDIYWHSHQLQNGTTLYGWNVLIDTHEKEFVLGISTKDGPYQNLMSCLINVDFSLPVMFRGFLGDKRKFDNGKWVPTGEKQKVLLISQEEDSDGKPAWIRPAYEPKFLERLTIQKAKEGIELSEKEKKSLVFGADGKINWHYPYIVEEIDKSNGNWDFRQWNEFLRKKMEEIVLPEVKEQAEKRAAVAGTKGDAYEGEDAPDLGYTGPMQTTADDDIPF